MNSVKKLLRKHEVIKIKEEKPNSQPAWRAEKNKTLSGVSKVTTTETFKKKEAVPAKEEEPKTIAETIYSKTAVKDMKRKQQEEILTAREIKFSDKDKEIALISKILSSNPKK